MQKSPLENVQRTLLKGSLVHSTATHNMHLFGHSGSSGRSWSLVSLPVLPNSCTFPGLLAGTS